MNKISSMKKCSMKYFNVMTLLVSGMILMCAAAGGAVSEGVGSPGSSLIDKVAGKWLIYDLNLKGAPAALEITADGFVKVHLLNIVPPFSDKAYGEWLFKKSNDEEATAKSPGGDIMKLSLEKAGSEIFLQATLKDTTVFLYRPRGGQSSAGFEGTWNMPGMPILVLKEDGTATFPAVPLPKYGNTGKFKEISGGRIAVIMPDKNGVETVILVLEPSDDFNVLKFSLDEKAYKEAGNNIDVQKDELKPDTLRLIKGPSGNFFYDQPMITEQIKGIETSRVQADYFNCRTYIDNLKTAEETYMMDNAKYAFSPELLDKYIGGCTDDASCAGKTIEQADASCAPGTLSITQETDGDTKSYKITAKSKGDNACNICVTTDSSYPQNYDGCPNTEMNCGK